MRDHYSHPSPFTYKLAASPRFFLCPKHLFMYLFPGFLVLLSTASTIRNPKGECRKLLLYAHKSTNLDNFVSSNNGLGGSKFPLTLRNVLS